ncbi:MAG: 5'/3'-nucleotidase SurE [Pseudomonadota bacterium]
MHVLLTNDDGIHAPGLLALCRRLSRDFTVTVVAPDRERSAVGHGITLHQPLRAHPMDWDNGVRGFAVSGTPADCIKLALLDLMPEKPDIVVSGINPGANVGVNINYSGTVAAAKEAALYGIPAIAVSREGQGQAHYAGIADFTAGFAVTMLARGLPFGTFLNVNFPDAPVRETAGVRFASQGFEMFPETIEKRVDPRNRTYYWQGCDAQTFTADREVDGSVLQKKYIAITPISCDATDYRFLDMLKAWPVPGATGTTE